MSLGQFLLHGGVVVRQRDDICVAGMLALRARQQREEMVKSNDHAVSAAISPSSRDLDLDLLHLHSPPRRRDPAAYEVGCSSSKR